MKLFSFEHEGHRSFGVEYEGKLWDFAAVLRAVNEVDREANQALISTHPVLPTDMLSFIRGGEEMVALARRALEFASGPAQTVGGPRLHYRFDEVRLLAPIPRPGKILCSGVNYMGHLEENPNAVLPEFPFFFSKLPSAVIGPGEPIVCPRMSSQVDYEVEFAVVIGKRMKHTPEADVMGYIFGYTILHDVSARDVQFKDQQITLGKNFDTFAPMGPCIVTADEIPDPGNVKLRTLLNGETMQNGSTSDWVFPLPKLLSLLSQVMALEPGDIVTTGTPAGVGTFRKPPIYLKPGDRVVLEIEGIGQLENPVVAEEAIAPKPG